MRKLLRIIFFTLLSLAAAAILLLAWKLKVRPGLDDYQAHLHPDTAAAPGLVASWYGTSAVLLSDGTHAVFIDPFFSRPGGWRELMRNTPIAPDEALIQRWLDQAGITRLDAVLVSHSHYDHSMDAGVVARLTGAMLLGSASTANVGRGSQLPERQIRVITPGMPVRYGSFTISFIESRHAGATGGRPTGDITEVLVPPARYAAYRQGGTYSILVEHAYGKVLLHGSAGWQADMLRDRRADVVFLGIAATPALDDYFSNVVDAVGASRVFPTHWDDFTVPLDQPLRPLPFGVDLDGFFAQAAVLRPQLELLTLKPGQKVLLFPPR